jgi:hypothetical protein
MLFMVVEHFRGGDPRPVRDRFERSGRMMPAEVLYHASWIDPEGADCYQIMEAPDRSSLDQWIANWADIIDFRVVAVLAPSDYWAQFNANK